VVLAVSANTGSTISIRLLRCRMMATSDQLLSGGASGIKPCQAHGYHGYKLTN
jgi:hypothetical protein